MNSHYVKVDTALLPVDARTGEPLQPRKQPGYYPGFSTLSQSAFWDEATRETVESRVEDPPPRKFFTEAQWTFWAKVFDHLIPQTDRTPDRQVPLIPPLDHRLYENRTVGYRYTDMPHDRLVYHIGVDAINAEAQQQFGGDFLSLSHLHQDVVLKAIRDGKPQGAPEIWKKMSVHRFWQMIMSDAIDAYCAHPWTWDEMGFGGPAYPRAYTRLERGEHEPWEVQEKPYEWLAPQSSVSGEIQSQAHLSLEADQYGSPSQEGN